GSPAPLHRRTTREGALAMHPDLTGPNRHRSPLDPPRIRTGPPWPESADPPRPRPSTTHPPPPPAPTPPPPHPPPPHPPASLPPPPRPAGAAARAPPRRHPRRPQLAG